MLNKNYNRSDNQTDKVRCLVELTVFSVAEESSKQLCARAERRSGVNRKENRDDNSGHNLDYAAVITVAVLEKARNCKRVSRNDGVLSKS